METGIVQEFHALCNDCGWKGRRYGNTLNAETEMNLHSANFHHNDVTVIANQINKGEQANNSMNEQEAKLLFIRQSATEAYEKGEVAEATKGILKTIVELTVVNSMTKEEIGLHIGKLETARSFLAAFTQGIQIGYAKEVEPIFKAKRERERIEKLKSKVSGSSADKKVNELVELARSLAEGRIQPKAIRSKVHCDKCNNDVWDLEFHSCI